MPFGLGLKLNGAGAGMFTKPPGAIVANLRPKCYSETVAY